MIHLIVNPHSRSGRGLSLWQDAEKILKARQVPYTAHLTEYPGHATVLAAELTAPSPSAEPMTLIAMGGDGTLNEVVGGIRDFSGLSLGYIPTGSGNDFARGMGLPTTPEEALPHILESTRTRLLDVCSVTAEDGTVRRYMDSCGSGYDAQVCRDLLKSRFKKICNALHVGKLAYLAVGVGVFFRNPLGRGTLILNGRERLPLEDIFFVSFQNLPYEGGGFRFAPPADPADGCLTVCAVSGGKKPALLPVMLRSKNGGHTKSPLTRILTCREAELILERPAALHTDGEVLPLSSRFTVRCGPEKVSFIV